MKAMRGRALRTAAMLSVALIATALSGCASSPTPPTPAPSPSPTASPLFASEEEALAAATEAYAAYLAAVETVGANGGEGDDLLAEVAGGRLLEEELGSAANYRRERLRSTGTTTFDSVSLQRLGSSGAEPALTVLLCLDVTNSDVLDQEGKSQVVGSRIERFPLQVAFAEFDDSPRVLPVESETWSGDNFC